MDFVVDEAHAVLGWGDDFPSGLSDDLRPSVEDSCGNAPRIRRFRTILQSATLTEYDRNALKALFAPSDKADFLQVIEAGIRTDAEVWIAQIGSWRASHRAARGLRCCQPSSSDDRLR